MLQSVTSYHDHCSITCSKSSMTTALLTITAHAYKNVFVLAFIGHFLPSLYHIASGCRLARLGLMVILQVKVALSVSFPKVTSNFSVKVMLIFVYLISGKMGSEKHQNSSSLS